MKKLLLVAVLFFLSRSYASAYCFVSQIAVSGPTAFCTGDSVQLSAYAYNDEGLPPTVQWYRNNAPIPGATQNDYYAKVTGNYHCVSIYCMTGPSSNTVAIQVASVPVVTITPGPVAICSGSSLYLTATIAGAPILTQYVWSNGVVMSTSTYSDISVSAAGNYSCIVSNACGTDSSDTVTTTVVPTPGGIISSSGPTMLCNGGTTVLSTDTGSNYSYTWYKNGSVLSGMTLPNYLVTTEGNYYVKVRDTTNNCFRNSDVLAVAVGPLAVTVSASPVPLCSGSYIMLTATTNTSVSSYQWKENGIPVYPFGIAAQYPYAHANSSYTVDVTNICGTVTSAPFTPASLPVPNAHISAASSVVFCSPDSVVLSADTGSNLAYQWYFNAINSPVLNAVNASYAATTAGNYFVKVTDTINGCSATSNSIKVSSNGFEASVTPAGPVRVCDSLVLTANGDTSFSYQWRKNGVNIPGATSNTYTAYHAAGARNYDVLITGPCGSNASNVVSATVDSMTIPHNTVLIFISPSTCSGLCGAYNITICEGLTARIGFNRWFPYGPQVRPQWYLNGDSILNPNDYLSGSNYDNWVIENLTAPGIYYCDISNGCGVTRSDTNTLIVEPVTHAVITANGPTTFCPGGSVTLTADTASGLSYQWRKNGIQLPGDTGSTLIVTQAGTYRCFMTHAGSCDKLSNFINVFVGFANPVIVAGSTNLCDGGHVNLNVTPDSSSTYQWNLNSIPIAGASSSSYSADSVGSYTCLVSNTCGSALSDPVILTMASAPTASITPAGSTTFCAGDSVALNANTGTGLLYQWKLNGGNISGATASSMFAKAAGDYTCLVTNSCGNILSNQITVTLNPAPLASITPTGSTAICAGDSVALNANTGTGLLYQWKLNGGNIPGAISSTWFAKVAGNYSCIVTNSCGNILSNQIAVSINPLPGAFITAGGATSYCTGGSVVLSANSGSGLSYQWQLNGSDIAGANSDTYSATANGNYSCIVSNSCGNVTSNSITTVLLPIPVKPHYIYGATTVHHGTTHVYSVAPVNGADAYHWTVSPWLTIVSGQGTSSITINFPGRLLYGVISVSASNACGTSALRYKIICGLIDSPPVPVHPSPPDCSREITVTTDVRKRNELLTEAYPNPSSNYFTIKITSADPAKCLVVIKDLLGKEVERKENFSVDETVNMGFNLPSGIYFAEVIQGDERKVLRLIKNN